jgi:hypothetical protein
VLDITTSVEGMGAVVVFAVDQHSPAPAFPIGWLVMWWLCARRRDEPIGGWLAYYYYQLYMGVLVTVLLVAANIHSYVPEYFSGETQRYLLFLSSVLPSLILYVFQAAVATFLLALKTWDMVGLLRKVLIAQVIVEGLGLLVDAKYFPENVSLSLFSFVPSVLWAGYFFRSERVKRVFKTHDWIVHAKAAATV